MSCLVMHPLPVSEASGACLSTEEINQELQRKRAALDDEIRRFTAQKNAEFETFEKELRAYLAGKPSFEAKSDLTSIITQGSSFDRLARVPSESITRDQHSNQQLSQDTSLIAPDTDFAKRPIEARPPTKRVVDQEPRELELGALFTSSYLPLLDTTFQDYRKVLSNDEDRISSSLDSQSQATKAERPGFLDRRLSSSPTGTGRSHKSSLRRPTSNNAHRERKRVLFSIDNQVMSPNASPENLRSAVIEASRASSFGPNSVYPNFASLMEPENTINKASAEPWTRSVLLTSPTRTYKDLVEPTIITPPEELEQEELQLITSDPLFGNDEPAPQFEDEDWADSPIDDRSSDEEETAATSPHVGSIPIQIRPRSRT